MIALAILKEHPGGPGPRKRHRVSERASGLDTRARVAGSARPFLVWLGGFYVLWLAFVIAGSHGATVAAHWPIAVAMTAGSYVAGSTPMGGGTVGFPILVLAFGQSAALGRDFAFAVQAVGMTSASIYILAQRKPIERRFLGWAIAGSTLGTPLGLVFLAPWVPEVWVKMLFAVVWASFGVMHLVRTDEICSAEGVRHRGPRFDRIGGLTVGLLGGACVASITGVGIDMMLYVALVLLARADLKIAIPTSVILMAFTSLVGIAVKLTLGTVQPGTWENWLAAAPVVAIGAPLGAMVVSKIGRRPTLLIVSVLCVGQFFWTLIHERANLTAWNISSALLGVVLFLLVFQEMYAQGYRMARRQTRNP